MRWFKPSILQNFLKNSKEDVNIKYMTYVILIFSPLLCYVQGKVAK
jgi:hypothetical protein